MDRRTSSLSIACGILALVAIGFVLRAGREVLLPLAMSALLFALARPLVGALERRGIPWGVTVLALVLVLFAGLVWAGTALVSNLERFLATEPAAASAPGEPPTLGDLERETRERLVRLGLPREAVEALPVRGVATAVGGVASGLLGFGQQAVLVLLFTIFLFAERQSFRRKILLLAGEKRRETEGALEDIAKGVQTYLSVKTALNLAVASVFVGLLLVLRVPYPALFGALTFLFNFVPVVGGIVSAVLPAATAWIVSDSIATAAGVLGGYLVIDTIVTQALEPRLLGRSLNLSPLAILVATLFWSALWGLPGTILAIPLTATLRIVLAEIPPLRGAAILLSKDPGSAASA